MKIYNTRALSKHQRFLQAVLYGVPTAIACSIGLGILQRMLPIQFQIFYLGVGYIIAYVIRTFGRGVHIRFSVLAAVLTALSLLFADAIAFGGFAYFLHPDVWIAVISTWVSIHSIWSILGIAFRLGGIYVAYEQGRIV